jgi:hypothetical protein
VIPLKYDQVYSFKEGLARITVGDIFEGNSARNGYIDKTGKEIVTPKYSRASDFCDGLASVALNGKWGFIDTKGRQVIPLEYEYVASCFKEGLAFVELNGKYGFIDRTGKKVIPLIYQKADNFENGKARVEQNGKTFYIDKTGKETR